MTNKISILFNWLSKNVRKIIENKYFSEIYNRTMLTLSNIFVLPIISIFVFDFATINIIISIYLLSMYSILRFILPEKNNKKINIKKYNKLKNVEISHINILAVNIITLVIFYITNKYFLLFFIILLIIFSYILNWYEDNFIFSLLRFNVYTMNIDNKKIILFSNYDIEQNIDSIECIKICENIFFAKKHEEENEYEIELVG